MNLSAQQVRRSPRDPNVPRHQPGTGAIVDRQRGDGETAPKISADSREMKVAEAADLDAFEPTLDEGAPAVGRRQDADRYGQRHDDDGQPGQRPGRGIQGMAFRFSPWLGHQKLCPRLM